LGIPIEKSFRENFGLTHCSRTYDHNQKHERVYQDDRQRLKKA